PIFARRYDPAMRAGTGIVPLITAAHRARERIIVDAEGVGTVLAIHIVTDCIAREAAKDDTADDRTAIAMADRAADEAARDGAKHGARGRVLLAAIVAIVIARLRRCSARAGGKRQKGRRRNHSSLLHDLLLVWRAGRPRALRPASNIAIIQFRR